MKHLSNKKEIIYKFRVWLKRLGIIGLLFFLLKGILWIAIFAGAGSILRK